jgi:N-acetylhexosamine 1-kinase
MTDAPVDFATIFELPGEVVECRPLGGGHIHTSLLVVCVHARFVVQRVNRRIFADVDGLVANYRRVACHLFAKGAVVARMVPTRDGDWWFEAQDAGAWRAFEFLEGTETR